MGHGGGVTLLPRSQRKTAGIGLKRRATACIVKVKMMLMARHLGRSGYGMHRKLLACTVSVLVASPVWLGQSSHAETTVTEILGTFLGAGVTCPQFMIETGEQVSLMGEGLAELKVGQKLRLTGQIARASNCMQGQAFIVSAAVLVEEDIKE
jgi:hypothetical protein